jgi:hypothetical protein
MNRGFAHLHARSLRSMATQRQARDLGQHVALDAALAPVHTASLPKAPWSGGVEAPPSQSSGSACTYRKPLSQSCLKHPNQRPFLNRL